MISRRKWDLTKKIFHGDTWLAELEECEIFDLGVVGSSSTLDIDIG